MRKTYLCVCGLLAASCLDGALESDVSLPHDFDFTNQLPTDNSIVDGSVGDCYSPDITKAFHKVDDNSPSSTNLHWKITNLNDVVKVIGGDASKITGYSFYILNDSSAKLEIPASDISISADGSIHLVPNVDTSQLVKFLTGGSMQVCLFLSGYLSKDFPKVIHNNFTFHVEVEISKKI